jgi:DNA-binding GntR family transcriptional regulator
MQRPCSQLSRILVVQTVTADTILSMPPKATTAEARHAALAAEILRRAQQEGWRPGHRLTELSLAAALDVSRTPVRAALRHLAQSGIVRLHPDRGYVLAASAQRLAFARVKRPDTAEAALHARMVRDRLHARLPEVVTQTALLRRYRVGRAVLGQVLARMQNEALIAPRPGSGFVFTPTLETVASRIASFELRQAIEPAGLLSASFASDAAVLARLARAHEAMLARLSRVQDPAAIFALDEGFHEALAAMSGNPFFLAAIRQQNRMRRLLEFATYGDTARVRAWLGEHLGILARLDAGDRAGAASLLRAHLLAACTEALARAASAA